MDREQHSRRAPKERATFSRNAVVCLCGLLVLAVALVFCQAAGFGFVNYDDDVGIYENRLVTGEVSLQSLGRVFTEHHADSSAPLTCVSHILVWHLLGHDAGIHHLVNVLLHAATAVLLLLVLRQMTGRLWPSAVVAAVFAVHPLRAESVAWATERKDVLSGLFFVLTLAAYTRYVRWSSPFEVSLLDGVGPRLPAKTAATELRRLSHMMIWYSAVIVLFALSLAAKPMAVTLPLLFLLLDFWPLGRMHDGQRRGDRRKGDCPDFCGRRPQKWDCPPVAPFSPPDRAARFAAASRLVLEKAPLLVVAGVFCLLNIRGQDTALGINEWYSFPWRIGNALISYTVYLGQLFWPTDLAACYPRRSPSLSVWQISGAILVLSAVTAASWACRRKRPYLLVGWLWYVGMLVPVIGLVQFGAQAEADRFTYLPEIGLGIALAWTAAEACRTGPRLRRLSTVVAAILVPLLAVSGWRQVSFWHDSQTLWVHTLACTPQNALAHNNLGYLYGRCQRREEAFAHLQSALEMQQNYAEAHNNLGFALTGGGRFDEATTHFQQALQINPNHAAAHSNLGNILALRGQFDDAVAHYQRALEIKPECLDAMNGLAWLRATCPNAAFRDGKAAIELADRAIASSTDNAPDFLDTLAAAYAEAGMFSKAVATAQAALILAKDQSKATLAGELAARLRLYQSGTPYREPPQQSAH